MDSYFVALGDARYRSTEHARGAWRDDEIHFSPLAGLVAHALDRAARPDGPTGLSRLSFEILGVLPEGEYAVEVETVRPGRTIELVEATATAGGRPVVRARAWFLEESDTSDVEGTDETPLPPLDEAEPWAMSTTWPGGYVASLDVRQLGEVRPGRATVWMSTAVALVEGEEVSPRASYLGLVDGCNGIAVRRDPREWAFPNVDLGIHLHRRPEGAWLGADTRVAFGPTGLGVTTTVLHDLAGPVGFAQQSLTLRRRPPASPAPRAG